MVKFATERKYKNKLTARYPFKNDKLYNNETSDKLGHSSIPAAVICDVMIARNYYLAATKSQVGSKDALASLDFHDNLTCR